MEFSILIFFLLLLPPLLLLRRRYQSHLPLPPGPLALPFLGYLPFLGPLPHSSLSLLSKRYGPIIFLKLGTRKTVILSSSATVRSFLKTLDAQFSSRPPGLTARDVAYGGEDMIFADHGPKWALLRKISKLHLLGPKAVERWSEVRREEVRRAIRAMVTSAQARRPMVILNLLINTMGNIIGRLTMSQRVFDGEEEEGSTEFKDMVLELLRGLPPNIGDFLPALAWMDLQGLKAKGKKSHQIFDRMITSMLAKHEAAAAGRVGRPDFLDAIKDAGEAGELTQVNIKGFIFDLFVAGTDAASVVTEWAISELLKNPDVLRRARSETDTVIGRHRLLQESDIPNLPYLQAICKEALRLHPSAPLGIAHYSSEPAEFEGYRIPGETQLMINIWAIGRDPNAWPDPLAFRPERFVDADEDMEGLMMAFGAGRRMCAGKQVGTVMVQYMLGSIIHGFDWEMWGGVEMDMEEGMGISLSKARPLSLLLSLRLDKSAYM